MRANTCSYTMYDVPTDANYVLLLDTVDQSLGKSQQSNFCPYTVYSEKAEVIN